MDPVKPTATRRARAGGALRAWRRPGQENLTAIVASVTFVGLATAVALTPVPYVAWGPGRTVDLAAQTNGVPNVKVDGLPTNPLNGELRMTTVSVTRVDSQLTLPEALFSYWMPKHDVMPRDVIYPPSKTVDQVKAEEVRMMDTSQRDAVVAALRAAGQPVTELPMVDTVMLSGPSNGKLTPGDLITKVDSTAVQSLDDVRSLIRRHKVGEPVVFTIERAGREQTVTVTTVASASDPDIPVVGISTAVGYKYAMNVTYAIDHKIVGPSAGLMFSLAIYDLINDSDLLDGRKVAGTGTIRPDGSVGPIGGIQEKIAGAEKAKAQIFLVPAENCQDISGVRSKMQLVKVTTLREAIAALQKLKQDPSGKEVPRC